MQTPEQCGPGWKTKSPAVTDSWKNLTETELGAMAEAGLRILECYRVLGKNGANVVGEVLKGQGEFYEWDHYPKDDVYDPETHAQYYYHAHPTELCASEHGHFHTFLRAKGMPPEVKPAAVPDYAPPREPNDALCHFVGISMNGAGYPILLFTTNRWVTGEIWYAADDIIAMLDRFAMDLAHPSWPVNIWITSMLRLFRPEICDLLRRRDRVVAEWRLRRPDANVFEDRDLEITSAIDIAIEGQIMRVRDALLRTQGMGAP